VSFFCIYALILNNDMKYLFFLFFCASTSIFSQNISFEKGEETKDSNILVDYKEYHIVDSLNNLVAVRPYHSSTGLKHYYLEFYADLNFNERKKINVTNNTEILSVFTIKNMGYVLMHEKKQGTIILKADIINFEDKTIERKQLLSVNKNDQPHNYKGLKTSSKINIDYSKDLLISYTSKKKEEDYVFLHFFNENLIETFNSKSLIGSEEARNVKLLDIKQHNNKAYVLTSYQDLNKKFNYQLFEIDQNEQKETRIITTDNNFEQINSIIIDNKHIISGLYSKKKDKPLLGYTYYQINIDTFKLSTYKTTEFKDEYLKKGFHFLIKLI